MKRSILALVSLCLSLFALPVAGDEGRIPIFAAPTVIAAPGQYFLTGNLAVAAGSLITITTGNVSIDLNGFTLTSTSMAPVITGTSVSGVSIRNGSIAGGGGSIEITGGNGIVIEDVRATGAGGNSINLIGCSQIAVRRVVVRDATGLAINLDNSGGPAASGTIENNLIEACADAIDVSSPTGTGPASSVAILNNRISNISGNGIFVGFMNGCLIADNTLEAVSTYGMFLQTDMCRISGNTIRSGGGFAIQQNGSDNLIQNNVVIRNVGRGFGIFGNRNVLEGNVSNRNGSFGYHISGSGNVYRRNTARGNGGVAGSPPACAGAAVCSPDLCVSPAGAATATSAGDNFLPGPPTFPACI